MSLLLRSDTIQSGECSVRRGLGIFNIHRNAEIWFATKESFDLGATRSIILMKERLCMTMSDGWR